jgi:hypothetical protein
LEQRLLFAVFTINGTTGSDTINISSHVRFINLLLHPFIDYSINGGATQSQDLFSFTSVTLDTTANTSGEDTVNVQTSPARLLTIIGHSTGGLLGPLDTLNVGGATGLQSVLGALTLSGGIWNVTLDDSNDAAAARTATVDGGVTGVVPAGFTWVSQAGVNNLSLNMGSFGGSTVNVITPNVGGTTTVTGYSNGADDTMNLGSNHLSTGVNSLAIAVAPGSPRGLWNVSLDDSADTMTAFPPPSVGVSSGALSGLTGYGPGFFGGSFPFTMTWGPGSVRNMNVSPPGLFGVSMNSLDIPMTFNISANQMQVGNATNGLQSINGALTVNGRGILTLNDTNDVTSRSVLMSRVGAAVAIDGLAPATISYNMPNSFSPSPSVEMDLWNNFDGGSLTVLASGQTAGLTKVVSPRPLAINIGNLTTAPDIQGTLALYCTGSNLKNTLHVNDSIDSSPRSITVTATKDSSGAAMGVIRGLPGGGDVDYAHAQTAGPVVIDGGSGGNVFMVNATDATSGGIATSVPLTLNLGGGNDTATIKTNAVTVNGQGGNDSLTVDYSTVTISGAGTFAPGDVAFDGGANSDTLSILGKISTQSFGVIATAVTQGAQTTSFSNVESMTLANGAFALANDLNGLNLSLSGAGSTAALSTGQHLGSLSVASSALATLASSPSALGKTIFATGLSLTTGGSLDLTNNALQIAYSADPAAALRGYLSTGYANGAWNGAGLRSSTAAAGTPNVFSLGLGDSADSVVSGLAANTLVVRYTVMGDANLDRADNYTDALLLQANYNHANSNWDQGDFNFDGVVNSVDALLLARNYNALLPAAVQAAAQAPPAPVPAPANTITVNNSPTIPVTTDDAARTKIHSAKHASQHHRKR